MKRSDSTMKSYRKNHDNMNYEVTVIEFVTRMKLNGSEGKRWSNAIELGRTRQLQDNGFYRIPQRLTVNERRSQHIYASCL